MYLNKAIIFGNLTRDPELKSLPSGHKVVSFGLATNRVWKNQEGQKQEATEFHNVVAFGKQAELIAQYLQKGRSALIEGRIQTRSWAAEDGSKRYRTEIVADRVQFGPWGGGQGGERKSPGVPSEGQSSKDELETIQYPEEDSKPEDIPF